MGPGDNAGSSDTELAFELGKLISGLGYTLLTGGRNTGVMEAAMRGAKENSGITVGVLPGSDTAQMSEFVDIPIVTGMGNARNAINILSCQVIIVVGEGAGTLSEVALALKSHKPVIWLNYSHEAYNYFSKLHYPLLYFIEHLINEEIEQLIKKLTSKQ